MVRNHTEPIQVSDIVSDPGEHSVSWSRHAICFSDVPITSLDRWDGGRVREHNWVMGSFCFLPADSRLVSLTADVHYGALLLDPVVMASACRGIVDIGSIDLEYRQVVSEPAAQLIAAVRSVATSDSLRDCRLLAESAATAVSVAALRSMSPKADKAVSRLQSGLGSDRMRRVVDFIDTQIGRQFSVSDLADVAALSPYHFSRSFQRETGMSPLRYVSSRRVELARQLLGNKAMIPLAEVALRCGFCSQAHMTTVFKRLVGVTPGEFRRMVVGKIVAVLVSVAAVLEGLVADGSAVLAFA